MYGEYFDIVLFLSIFSAKVLNAALSAQPIKDSNSKRHVRKQLSDNDYDKGLLRIQRYGGLTIVSRFSGQVPPEATGINYKENWSNSQIF